MTEDWPWAKHPEAADAEPLEHILTRSLRLETLAVLQTFGWFLERYRRLADPLSFHLAQGIYETLRLESESRMTSQEAEAYLCRVRKLTCALAEAVREWREGAVP